MNDQERIASLEARMHQMEAMIQELLTILTTSGAESQKTIQMQTMLQELHIGPHIHTAGTGGINPVAVTPQERPENRAIQEALLAGDNVKAIKLYRELYGCSLQEAAGALRITLHRGR